MNKTIKKLLRTAQTRLPALKKAKDLVYLHGRRTLRLSHDPDFKIVQLLRQTNGAFVDIGANQGQSIESILLYRPDARIISFEANPGLGGKLARRYRGRPNITVHSCGLGDASGKFVLHVPSYNGFVYDGLASLDRAEAEGWLNDDTVFWFDQSKLNLSEIECRVETLDAYRIAPAFIKIDVQGFEYKVVAGGLKTIAAHKPVLLIEGYRHEPRIAAALSDFGYEEYQLASDRVQRGLTSGANSLLMTADTADALACRTD